MLFWSNVMTKFLWIQVWCTAEVNKLFQGWIMECLLHPSVLDNRFSSRTMFWMWYLLSLQSYLHRKEINLYVANLQTKQRDQWLLNPQKSSNYIFRTGSFPNVVSYYHRTLSSQRHVLGVQMGIYFLYVEEQLLIFVGPCIIVITEEQKPTRGHLLFYCSSYRVYNKYNKTISGI